MQIRFMLTATMAALIACPVNADPCEGKLPAKAGTVFTGTVRYIVDGDGICVGPSADPNTWVEVRLADFDAPELKTQEGRHAKQVMSQLAMGKPASCVTRPGRSGRTTSYDRVIASCKVDGASLASLMRQAGVLEGGN
jgi:endonuclease YncB( thermonuclease family)